MILYIATIQFAFKGMIIATHTHDKRAQQQQQQLPITVRF